MSVQCKEMNGSEFMILWHFILLLPPPPHATSSVGAHEPHSIIQVKLFPIGPEGTEAGIQDVIPEPTWAREKKHFYESLIYDILSYLWHNPGV